MKKTILTIIFLACAMSTLVAQDKAIQIFKNGEIIQSYELGSIDYIEINDVITPPSDIDADMESGKIIIKWQAVEGATYNIYRSADNQSYYLLAEELTENQYVDNNPLPGTNYYKVKAIVDGIESDYSQSSAGVTLSDSGLESGIYLGITGFNQQIYSYPINKLTDESKDGFDSFIDGLNMKNGTLLYYSVDETISAMQSVQLPADLSTAAIVTFTDGLDQGSIMMNGSYQDNTEYLNAINNRIKNEKIGGKPITAYSIGIRGQDVADVTTFQNNLLKLASSSENATEVTSMAEVNAKFKDIAEQLSQSNYIQTISLKMPGVSNGTVVRFTFDNVNSATKSTLYIEGTFNLSTRLLEDVKYVGLSSTSGMIINGVVDGIFVSFTFENVHTDNNVLIDNQFIDEWIYIPSNDIWQVNSEFDKDENSDIVTERSSAVIVLVLDCSSSLADDFVKAQANAKDFINTLYGAVGDNENSDDDSNNVIYSTTPQDLTLAIWKNGTRYYLTKEEYDKANLSDVVIEGVAIVSGGESFILSLKNVQTDVISSISTANNLYGDIMPTKNQGEIISAKWNDINTAIADFGGTELKSGKYYYTTSTASGTSWNYHNCISGSGGSLYSTDSSPYVRGVTNIEK